MIPAVVLLLWNAPALPAESTAAEHEARFVQRTQWVMGTALSIHLPRERQDKDQLFRDCFAIAQGWDDLLSPWKPEAPLTRLSAQAGQWVELPLKLLEYLRRAQKDARRSQGVFDITLTLDGSSRIEVDWEGSRARLPVGAQRLDPGGDGKGVALDAIAVHLHRVGVLDAFLDFGGSSFLAKGLGPTGTGWRVALHDFDGITVGELRLVDTALSVSSTVQREQLAGGAIQESYHLVDLQSGKPVKQSRSVAVLASSATDAEVLSTSLAILGSTALDGLLLEEFPGAAIGAWNDEAAPVFRGGFESYFTAESERP